jgi:hypothetical protein
MESLARLVAFIFLIIYLFLLSVEIGCLIGIITKFLPQFGGYWYFLWIPILIFANWFATIFVITILSKIKSS